MSTPIKIYPNVDGYIRKLSTASFNAMRIAGGVSVISTTSWGMANKYLNASDLAYQNEAMFLEFDTRSITVPPLSLTFNIYIYDLDRGGNDFYVMRSYWASDNSLVPGDYASWVKSSAGGSANLANMHKYSSKQTAVDDTWFNITLDSVARVDIANRDYFQIAIISDNEVDGVSAPNDGFSYNFSAYTDEQGDPGSSPYIEYEPGTNAKMEILGGNTKILSGKVLIK